MKDLKLKYAGFTLVEILLALTVIGLISVLVLPSIITKFQTSAMQKAYDKQITSLVHALELLPTEEGKYDFTKSSMYLENAPDSYDDSSGLFLKKHYKINKYCGDNPSGCFVGSYTSYTKDETGKVTRSINQKPLEDFSGSCAILKNGMSICIRPQEGNSDITGWIDVNGKRGPNVIGRDMRSFSISPKSGFKVEGVTTSEVWETDLECPTDDLNAPVSCCRNWLRTNRWSELPNAKMAECCNLSNADLSYDSPCCDYFRDNVAEESWPETCNLNLCSDISVANATEFCCSQWEGTSEYSSSPFNVREKCCLNKSDTSSCCADLIAQLKNDGITPDISLKCCVDHPVLCSGCGDIPKGNRVSEQCCSEWFYKGLLTASSIVANSCCDNIEFHDSHEQFCSIQVAEPAICQGTVNWNVQFKMRYTTALDDNLEIYPGVSGDYICNGTPVISIKVTSKYAAGSVVCGPIDVLGIENTLTSCVDLVRRPQDGGNSDYLDTETTCEVYVLGKKVSDSCSGSYNYSGLVQ